MGEIWGDVAMLYRTSSAPPPQGGRGRTETASAGRASREREPRSSSRHFSEPSRNPPLTFCLWCCLSLRTHTPSRVQ